MLQDEVIELVDGRMWKRLLRYAGKSNYLMGAALSKPDVEDKGAAGEHDDILVTDMGILVNHAYTLLDVREVRSRRISIPANLSAKGSRRISR